MTPTAPDFTTLYDKPSVAQTLRMSERSLERLVRARRFPAPVRLGRNAYWHKAVVDRWLEATFTKQLSWDTKRKVSATRTTPG